MDKQFFYELVDKYLDGTATGPERRVVETYYQQLSGQEATGLSADQKAAIRAQIYESVQARIKSGKSDTPVIPLWRRLRTIAAAIIILVLAGTTYYILHTTKRSPDLAGLPQTQRYKNDIPPAHQGATLTLSSGQTIRLDSAANGTIASQDQTTIRKQDSALSYIGKSQPETVFYNTVSTAKGQTYQVQLADGTEVWLDAESSIRFPTSFPGPDRIVGITGQAYFEVARNANKPFRVQAAKETVDVLGTHFNMNAYEANQLTTLLEGSIRVSAGSNTRILAPGQQAQAATGAIHIIPNPDLDETMAWKNGRFGFHGASMEQIMTQLARWYDIDVAFKGKIPETFVANIARDLPLSRMLGLLEMTKEVAFTIEGRKITVYNLNDKK